MERTSLKLPPGTYIMEVTSWIIHHGRYLMEIHHGSYLMERTPWKLPHGTYTMEGASWNLHH